MSHAAEPSAAPTDRIVVEGALVRLFGHDAADARLEVEPRPRAWRIRRAALPLVVGLALAPLVGLVPPHAPWAVASLGAGLLVARRRWKEEFTIRALDARCPRCDEPLPDDAGRALRFPHALTCESCGHEPAVHVDPDRLRERA